MLLENQFQTVVISENSLLLVPNTIRKFTQNITYKEGALTEEVQLFQKLCTFSLNASQTSKRFSPKNKSKNIEKELLKQPDFDKKLSRMDKISS